MKDIIRKILIIGFPIVFIAYLIIKLSFDYLFHKEMIDFGGLLIQSLIFTMVFISFQLLVFYNVLKPGISFLKSGLPIDGKFRHIETNFPLNGEKPNFKAFVKSLHQDFIITYTSEENNLVKIREKIRFWSWGAAALIKVDYENDCLQVNSFPLNGIGKKAAVRLTGKIKDELKKYSNAKQDN
ncbi:MAG TPA: hypothetical protein VE912_14650 [Bacteroidales bacterium]|nr:hypothetical protein [Bacteroidales bacterium]